MRFTHCCVLLHGVQRHSSSSSQIQNALLLKPAAHGVIKAEFDRCYLKYYFSKSTNIDAGSPRMHWNSRHHTGTIWVLRGFFPDRVTIRLTHIDNSNHSRHSNDQDFIFWKYLQGWWYKNFYLTDKLVNFTTRSLTTFKFMRLDAKLTCIWFSLNSFLKIFTSLPNFVGGFGVRWPLWSGLSWPKGLVMVNTH